MSTTFTLSDFILRRYMNNDVYMFRNFTEWDDLKNLTSEILATIGNDNELLPLCIMWLTNLTLNTNIFV